MRQVVTELRGEKVDIVPYTDDAADFVMKALAPARVREVRIHPDTGTAEVIVPDFQLSLAIGKEGQNARLAARLSGWRVDIKSETQLAEEESGGGVEYAEGEWVENATGELVWQPAEGGDAISAAEAGYAAPFAGMSATGADGEDATPDAAARRGGCGRRPRPRRLRSTPRPSAAAVDAAPSRMRRRRARAGCGRGAPSADAPACGRGAPTDQPDEASCRGGVQRRELNRQRPASAVAARGSPDDPRASRLRS